ncbi:MAG: DUF2764 family protein [Gammaproteobacteria bacterium]
MIHDRYKYVMLLSSLPLHPINLFAAQQTPVSRIQLDKRLALLDEDDGRDLARIEALLHWSRIGDLDDATHVKQDLAELAEIKSPFLKDVVLWRLELRTLMSALRRRRAGETKPPGNGFHGFGVWPRIIEQHWQEKDFGLGQRLPWLAEANSLIEQDKTFELEKLLLNLVWRHYARVGSHHYFDYPAVVVYVLRWDVINRWSGYDKEIAQMRFDKLVGDSLS